MALEMQNFEALSPQVVKKITWWTLFNINHQWNSNQYLLDIISTLNQAQLSISELQFRYLAKNSS